MSLPDRLRRLERRVEALEAKPKRCPTCHSPVPCLPSSVVLIPEGFMFNTAPCETCGGPGGGELAIPYDLDCGVIGRRGPMVGLGGISLQEWLRRHRGRDFGNHRALLVEWLENCVRQTRSQL